MFGVKILKGTVVIGDDVYTNDLNGKHIAIGKVISMQKNNKSVTIGTCGDEICIKMDGNKYFSYGKDFDHTCVLKKDLSDDEIYMYKFVHSI